MKTFTLLVIFSVFILQSKAQEETNVITIKQSNNVSSGDWTYDNKKFKVLKYSYLFNKEAAEKIVPWAYRHKSSISYSMGDSTYVWVPMPCYSSKAWVRLLRYNSEVNISDNDKGRMDSVRIE